MTTLADISRGELARVDRVSGDDYLSVRLLEMGLTPGCYVQFLNEAPLGDPREYLVRGYRLSLRRTEAARVLVTRCG
jgi:ferrous iron transport protein A